MSTEQTTQQGPVGPVGPEDSDSDVEVITLPTGKRVYRCKDCGDLHSYTDSDESDSDSESDSSSLEDGPSGPVPESGENK